MAVQDHVIGLAGFCTGVGLCLLACSSILVNECRLELELCKGLPDRNAEAEQHCDNMEYWAAAGAFGIIASAIQIASIALVMMDKLRPWSGMHILIFALCSASFGIAAAKNALNWKGTTYAKIFASMTFIDIVASLLAVALICKSTNTNSAAPVEAIK